MQAEMGVNSLIFTITQRTTKVIDADRCTLYLVDNIQRGLFAMQGEVNIRISMEQGIAGYVASTGEVLNIPDAYDHPQFNQAIDKKSGYRTKAILCMPIKRDDMVVGVIQLINKMDGSGVFLQEDEDVMAIFLAIAGPILAESTFTLKFKARVVQPTREVARRCPLVFSEKRVKGGIWVMWARRTKRKTKTKKRKRIELSSIELK